MRALELAAASLVTTVLATVAALATLQASLPPEDGASGVPFLLLLLDPAVFLVAAFLAVPAGLVGWIAALLLLWRERVLMPAVPVAAVVTIGTAAVAAPVLHVLSSVVALLAGVLAMAVLRTGGEERPRDPGRRRELYLVGFALSVAVALGALALVILLVAWVS